ncbi:MAG: HNH endonuclease [Lysinibacillus fusiformis]|nr:HNH endonuclease [Lysinibacillus fusiformis]MCT6927445.1 HNH endonuclease [Lysinibacillus fusiformis]MCT6931781.1 HNH endonuclease [Lysinibacillus fusiformis]
MERVILQPTGSKESRMHYNDTIHNPVELKSIEKFLDKKIYEDLLEIYPNGYAHIWGVTPGKNNVNVNKWGKINKGDIAFFSANKVLFTSGTVALTLNNKSLAKHLWGKNKENYTWQYIYFLDSIKNHEISIEVINELIGYKNNYVVQGFTVLDEHKSRLIIESYDLYSDKHYSKTNKTNIEKKLKKLLVTGTDSERNIKARKEQRLLSEYLFEGKYKCKCQICNEEYPVEFLHTAHIKKRQFCDDNERLDVKNIVMPICKFGCDDLFEKGYIVVNNGEVIINRRGNTDSFNEKLGKIEGNHCDFWNENTKVYFQWHQKFHSFFMIN